MGVKKWKEENEKTGKVSVNMTMKFYDPSEIIHNSFVICQYTNYVLSKFVFFFCYDHAQIFLAYYF